MIAKTEAMQRLKKMGMTVADDASIVTVLLPKEVSFEAGLKDVRNALTELGYEASFCVKQSKDATTLDIGPTADAAKGDAKSLEASGELADETKEEASEETLSEEEINSYMVVDDDGQFSLGLEF